MSEPDPPPAAAGPRGAERRAWRIDERARLILTGANPTPVDPPLHPAAGDRGHVDVYPIGWLSVLLGLRRAYLEDLPAGVRGQVRRHARSRVGITWRHNMNEVRHRQWRALANTFNGYLAEPVPIPADLRRCGSGWTRRRALRSLRRHGYTGPI